MSNSATWLGTDITTKGTWKSPQAYGVDGYSVINDATAYPSYATVTITNGINFSWAASTSDVRALQKTATPTDRIAAIRFNGLGSIFIDINCSDTSTHKFSIYALDWDGNPVVQNRYQNFVVRDGDTNVTLDTQNSGNFYYGIYYSWNITGHIIVEIVNVSAINIGYSGLFFDSASIATSNRYVGGASLDVLAQPTTADMRIGQVPIEFARLPTDPKIRISQAVIEYIRLPDDPKIRHTQAVIELIKLYDTSTSEGWKIEEA